MNDLDGLISNFWRAIKNDPESVAEWADNPVNENDLHARHVWLVRQLPELHSKIEGNPDYHDVKIAGWWVWGVCCWIGSGFCSGNGPWQVDERGKLVHLGDNGQGVNRKLVHLGDNGRGVNRKLVHLGDWFVSLANRLRNVRICSGDWTRVCGPSVTHKHGLTAVFLDPPYADTADRQSGLYRKDCDTVAHKVREWAITNGNNQLLRIALCGYDGEHEMPDEWECVAWNAGEGFGGQAKQRTNNGKRERIWFSPACLKAEVKQEMLL